MRSVSVGRFTHQSRQMQMFGGGCDPDFLVGFTASAAIGRFTCVHHQFASAWAPQPQVGFFCAPQKQHLIRGVEHVDQGGNDVG